ncbi:uncharacterized protein MELLADRAFT_87631 [Melampsora larici-populina 98AG31]|uniref:Secreted protein n=1 Tax=Melampsora larici-populina (strain 98AG31 / pathotype 3-4-7) TaxID=747676 RepID=F4RP47_MELLP|nr:uncharacterized protein MELLADRAFT_87631 [Melampsora larici-populina 98AG31]EGG05756.1 hypothetical protein MELLADRAFT_87631 [Melampsora larici-populina 98AG31]
MIQPYGILALAVFLIWYNRLSAVSGGTINLKFEGLYPENGASLPSTGMMYYSAVYKATVVKYDPKRQNFKEITIPSVTGQPNTHVSGIEADRSSPLIWAIVNAASAFDTNGAQISGPAGLVGIDTNDKIVFNVDLNPALQEVQRVNGGIEAGGAQDATTDHEGNVYISISFGQTILKFDPKTQKTSIFYMKMQPKPKTMGITGIELVNSNTLIVWNNENGKLESFDIHSPKVEPFIPKGDYLPKTTIADGVFIPSFSKGTCLLLNNCALNQVEVLKSHDNWKTVTHAGSIPTKKFSGISVFTYEIDSRIYFGTAYFTDPKPRNRNLFPQGDITHAVTKACT